MAVRKLSDFKVESLILLSQLVH